MMDSMEQNLLVKLSESPSEAVRSGYLVDISSLRFSDGGSDHTWLQALPLGKWSHPVYGDIEITPERTSRFAENVKQRVRGQDLDINYDHRGDPAKGNKAAGWIVDAEARSDGLWLAVSFTETARREIRNGEWKYFSPEFVDVWQHPSDGQKFRDVLFGGGLTNRPYLKGILPINLSEVFGFEPKPRGEESSKVDEIRKLLGLSEDASEEDVLSAIRQLNESGAVMSRVRKELELSDDDDVEEKVKELAESPPSNKEKEEETTQSTTKSLSEMTLAELTDASPAVKELVGQVAKLEADKVESQIDKQLNDLKADNRVLSETAKQSYREAMLQLGEDGRKSVLTAAEQSLKDGGGVELGQITTGGGDRQEATATKRFNDRIAKLMKESDGQLTFGDATEMAAKEDPQLYNEYRTEAYSREEV